MVRDCNVNTAHFQWIDNCLPNGLKDISADSSSNSSVLQGSVLSLILFNMFISALEGNIKSLLTFVDDRNWQNSQ